jgi:hypothetical protein
MVAEGDEVVAFRLCRSSSTSISLVQVPEGKLADLRIEAMVARELQCLPFSLEMETMERY